MEKTYEFIKNNYLVDGEDERYATLFFTKDEIIEEIDREIFENKYNVNLDELLFPIITFDFSGSVDGFIYDQDSDKDEIIDDASEYFTKKTYKSDRPTKKNKNSYKKS